MADEIAEAVERLLELTHAQPQGGVWHPTAADQVLPDDSDDD
jgi:hypothetical protein